MTSPVFTTALEAEAAFYDALARSDLDAMTQVWSDHDEVVCGDGDRLGLVLVFGHGGGILR